MNTTRDPITGQKFYGDAAHVNLSSVGANGISHNRNIAAAATTHPGNDGTNTATWTSAESVSDLTVSVIAATGAALQNDEACLIVFDAPDAITAKAWLTDAGAAADDVEYHVVFPGQARQFIFDNSITRVDVLPLAVNMRVIVEAA